MKQVIVFLSWTVGYEHYKYLKTFKLDLSGSLCSAQDTDIQKFT